MVDEYFPECAAQDRSIFPSLEHLARLLGRLDVRSLPIPHDCTDGFLGAYWRRPRAYLDAGVRSAISFFAKLPAADLDRGLDRLRRDLDDGTWQRRFGHLLTFAGARSRLLHRRGARALTAGCKPDRRSRVQFGFERGVGTPSRTAPFV